MSIKATYRGKIGRLPKAVREKLNRRLDNGEAGRKLITWLNSLPGADPERPIIDSNLSRWKSGGYRDWLNQQHALAVAGRLAAETEGLKPAGTEESLADQTAVWLAARLLVSLEQAGGLGGEGGPDLRMLREFCRDVATLRRGEHAAARLKLEQARLEFKREARRGERYEFRRAGPTKRGARE
jgi:hypothetical protein